MGTGCQNRSFFNRSTKNSAKENEEAYNAQIWGGVSDHHWLASGHIGGRGGKGQLIRLCKDSSHKHKSANCDCLEGMHGM